MSKSLYIQALTISMPSGDTQNIDSTSYRATLVTTARPLFEIITVYVPPGSINYANGFPKLSGRKMAAISEQRLTVKNSYFQPSAATMSVSSSFKDTQVGTVGCA